MERKQSEDAPAQQALVWKFPRPKSNGQLFVGFDLESSGDDVVHHGTVELGAAIVDSVTGEELIVFDSAPFALPELPVRKGWKESTVKWYIETRRDKYEAARAAKQTAKQAVGAFVDFLLAAARFYGAGKLDLLVDTTVFDVSMLNTLLNDHGHPPIQRIFGNYRDLTATDSFHAGVAGVTASRRAEVERIHKVFSADRAVKDWWRLREAKLPDWAKTLVISWPINEHEHDAWSDALYIAKMHACVHNRLTILECVFERAEAALLWQTAQENEEKAKKAATARNEEAASQSTNGQAAGDANAGAKAKSRLNGAAPPFVPFSHQTVSVAEFNMTIPIPSIPGAAMQLRRTVLNQWSGGPPSVAS